ncbi:MAG: LysM peptidoglycan-binding domain-containing protein [Lachnospiraceae bacterium]|nr:LysM peptidoglycan-binding domain-containing protein [Lachnospiraceae bacterium]
MKIRLKKLIKIICAIVMLLFLCLLVGKRIWEQRSEKTQYEQWGVAQKENFWTENLFSASQDSDYAYAFVWADDETADMAWSFPEDRDALVEAFTEEKEDMLQKEEDAALWYFVKVRLDEDIHGIDIYEYLEQNLSKEGDECYAHTLDGGCAYYIGQGCREEDERGWYSLWPKRIALICDGYLYVLVCNIVTSENRETVNEQMEQFQSFFEYNTSFYWGSNHFMDVEDLYWIDHEERVTELENPKCAFLEIKARDLGERYLDPLKGCFGMLKEAEYQTKISPEMPEITISFHLIEEVEGDCYETTLYNLECEHEKYRMEVRMTDDGRLLQEETVPLSICAKDMIILEKLDWKTDMVTFKDLNGDGYLDMIILHPNYVIDYKTKGYHEYYWLWNQETEKLEEMGTASQARLKASLEEETDMKTQTTPNTSAVRVEKGDSLWKIAEEYYGDGRRWGEIYEKNRMLIGENPSLILPGTELKMP